MTCAGSCLAEESAYVREIDQWHAERLASLKKPTGWLSLAGLFWLKDGAQSVGSHTSSDVVFPSDMPEHLGVITWQDGVVAFEPEKGVFSGGEAMRKQVLAVDTTGEPTVLTWGTYHWYVIVRGQQYGIRLRNTRHPNLDQFDGIDRFAVDGAWKLGAQFEAYDPPKTVEIPTVLGTISSEICPGRLLFEVDGRNYTLEPLGDMNEEEWFVIFGDETNGDETYGAGRFLSVARPDALGKTWIDFNKSYNPPCALTEFATCPLPPEQNKLAVRIPAGEKNANMHESGDFTGRSGAGNH